MVLDEKPQIHGLHNEVRVAVARVSLSGYRIGTAYVVHASRQGNDRFCDRGKRWFLAQMPVIQSPHFGASRAIATPVGHKLRHADIS